MGIDGFYFDPQALQGVRGKSSEKQALQEAAAQFEALFVHMLLKQMRATTFSDGGQQSNDSAFFQDMFDAQLAQHLGARAGFGVADMLVRQFNHAAGNDAADRHNAQALRMPARVEQALASIANELPLSAESEHAVPVPPPIAALSGEPVPPIADDGRVEAPQQTTDARHILQVAPGPIEGAMPAPASDNRRTADEVAAGAASRDRQEVLPVARPVMQVRSAAAETSFDINTANVVDDSPTGEDWRTPREFLRVLAPHAQRVADELGVARDVLLAQATLETGWGRKLPRFADGRNSYNVFGIKADTRWHGDKVSKPTLEFEQGMMRRELAQFRAYPSPADSFDDYADFLRGSPRYAAALANAGEPARYLRELQDAGYATDPDYAHKIHALANSDRFRNALPQ